MLLRGPPSTTALAYPSEQVNTGKIWGLLAVRIKGILAGLCLKVENSRVAAIIGSYPAILPL